MARLDSDARMEEANEAVPGPAPLRAGLVADPRPEAPARRPGWLPGPEQIWLAARITATLIIVVWLVAWPVGTTLALRETTGLWRIGLGYSGAVVILALSNAGLVLLGGYVLRAAFRLEETADRLGHAVRNFEPQLRTDAVRADIDELGAEVDRALEKLARAEAQIRQQVGAIDAAAETLRSGHNESSERLARERQALIDATAAMNAEAEAFAAALAEKTARSCDEAAEAVPDLEEKVLRLEKVSAASADQFAALREAMAESTALLREAPQKVAAELQGSAESLRQAQRNLLEESEKLRQLIDQQKSRADNLGRSLAAQSERLAERQEAARNLGGSWRRILDRVEKEVGTKPPLRQPAEDPPAPRAEAEPQPERAQPVTGNQLPDEQARLERMQRFTLTMKAQLFGMPTKQEQQRFERGERQLFTHQILAHDQIELRARMRAAMDGDESFAAEAENFLNDFDQLLSPIMIDDPEGAEAALQDMLRSPLGKLYVLIGTAKGHFV